MKFEWKRTFQWNRTFRVALSGGRSERAPLPEPKPIGAHAGYRPFPPLRPPARLDECYFTLIDNGRDVVFDEIYAVECHAVACADGISASGHTGRAFAYLAGDAEAYEIYDSGGRAVVALTAEHHARFLEKIAPYVSTAPVVRYADVADCQTRMLGLMATAKRFRELQDIGPDYDRILAWQHARWTFRSRAKRALTRPADPRATADDRARLEAMNDARKQLDAALLSNAAPVMALVHRRVAAAASRWYRSSDVTLPWSLIA